MNVLAIDPGGVTGIAFYQDGIYTGEEVPNGFDGMAHALSTAFSPLLPLDAVVIESFTINAGTHKKDPGMFADTTAIIGAVRYVASVYGIPVKMQTPAKAKAFATDDKLRRLGWYDSTPGGHRNDAARHLLTFLASERDYRILAALTPSGAPDA